MRLSQATELGRATLNGNNSSLGNAQEGGEDKDGNATRISGAGGDDGAAVPRSQPFGATADAGVFSEDTAAPSSNEVGGVGNVAEPGSQPFGATASHDNNNAGDSMEARGSSETGKGNERN